MFSKILPTAALALAASTLVSAQTFTLCDPTKKDCPPDPAFASSVTVDLTKGEPKGIFKNLDGTKVTYDGSNGAVFAINADTDAPTMASYKFIFFGRVDVTLQAAPGAGVVTSFVLQSDDLDEIDLEWVGGDNAQVQTNYFSKGDTSTYDRGAYHPVGNPTGQFHTYSIDWTKDRVQWLIDGAVIRTLTYADAKGGATFPQTPMQVKFGTWVAGKKDAPKGTVDWSGGYTNFADAPFIGLYKSITVTDYAGGSAPASNSAVKQYVYGDKTGTWQSIKLDNTGGDIPDDSSNSTSSSASGSASATGSVSKTATDSASQTTVTTSTVSKATTTVTTAVQTTKASTTSSGFSQTSAPSQNAAGNVVATLGNVLLGGGLLVFANMFVL
jgi:beta-glucanase (GH16 family)